MMAVKLFYRITFFSFLKAEKKKSDLADYRVLNPKSCDLLYSLPRGTGLSFMLKYFINFKTA